jgi:hypothetical protein
MRLCRRAFGVTVFPPCIWRGDEGHGRVVRGGMGDRLSVSVGMEACVTQRFRLTCGKMQPMSQTVRLGVYDAEGHLVDELGPFEADAAGNVEIPVTVPEGGQVLTMIQSGDELRIISRT